MAISHCHIYYDVPANCSFMVDLTGLVKGLHHITLVTSNEEINWRFYTEVMGPRRVKLTVNQDDIYHSYFEYSISTSGFWNAMHFWEDI